MESLFFVQEVTNMEIGAVLITAGCGSTPAMPCGGITVAQRMIASLQKAGVSLIVVVTDSEDKKLEKQLAQAGVFFLRNEVPEQEEISAAIGLNYLADKCDRVFLFKAERPLVDPDTLLQMLEVDSSLVIPVHNGKEGLPWLLKAPYSAMRDFDASTAGKLHIEDPGIILTAEESASMKEAISNHDRKLTRPVLDFTISRGKPLVDGKLITLLSLIRETQSVRDACNRMQISYSTAWNLLNGAEDSLGYPLILRNKGGPSGSGSLLTEKGSALLIACEQFESAARESLSSLYESIFQDVL